MLHRLGELSVTVAELSVDDVSATQDLITRHGDVLGMIRYLREHAQAGQSR